MPKVRYKSNPEITRSTDQLNIHAIAEVNMFDDSVYFKDLDVFITKKNKWIDLKQAISDGDIIFDNYNTRFFEPETEEDRKRGFTLN